jgi:hypothetical protein
LLKEQKVFAGTLTTDERVGVARSLHYTADASTPLNALVIVNHTNEYRFRINLRRGRYLGFHKSLKDGKIRMEQSKEAFLYD